MSELRKDPVVGRWVIMSPERGRRPSDFVHSEESTDLNACPFCEGNEDKTPPEIYAVRQGSPPNGAGWRVRVMANKFPALRMEGVLGKTGVGMYDKMNGIGAHEVIVETPEHDKRIEMHNPASLWLVLDTYRLRLLDLSKDNRFRYIMIFKNEGEKAGASLSHPHSQVIATPVTPKRVREELIGAREYYQYKDRCVFCDIIREEQTQDLRIVEEHEGFIAFCPFASRFPFEIWILPKKHSPDYHALNREELYQLAQIIISTMKKLSGVLSRPQYNYILHTGPVRWPRMGYWLTLDVDWHWHIEIMPRVTDVAGFEWGTGYYINPILPEEAARFMREADA